ncbi:Spy/CpxP family protein refolding chaperone [Paracidobacterium acidisoli]|nr:Spy/CpxP family protein refolding chaperone [Paracidobacterium acidisoli]MBT9330921.1 Spy/CpxP family protein refolding chaperone [Paracidobacterium acidisoli]
MLLRNNRLLLTASLLWIASVPLAFAQMGPPGGDFHRPPMERAFHDGHMGRWWDNAHFVQQIGLSDAQKHQMDDIFQQHRLKLIDLNASLQKQEAIMQPLVEADNPDETKILAQIDAVAQARAELEKANARMLFDLRKVLTPDQWKKVQTLRQEHRSEMSDHRGPEGPDARWRRFGPDHRDGGPTTPSAPPAGSPPPSGDAR